MMAHFHTTDGGGLSVHWDTGAMMTITPLGGTCKIELRDVSPSMLIPLCASAAEALYGADYPDDICREFTESVIGAQASGGCDAIARLTFKLLSELNLFRYMG